MWTAPEHPVGLTLHTLQRGSLRRPSPGPPLVQVGLPEDAAQQRMRVLFAIAGQDEPHTRAAAAGWSHSRQCCHLGARCHVPDCGSLFSYASYTLPTHSVGCPMGADQWLRLCGHVPHKRNRGTAWLPGLGTQSACVVVEQCAQHHHAKCFDRLWASAPPWLQHGGFSGRSKASSPCRGVHTALGNALG